MHNRSHDASIDIIYVYLISIIVDYLNIVLFAYSIYCTILWDYICTCWVSAHDLCSCCRHNGKYVLCAWWDVRIVTKLLEGGNEINYHAKLFCISMSSLMIAASFYKLLLSVWVLKFIYQLPRFCIIISGDSFYSVTYAY